MHEDLNRLSMAAFGGMLAGSVAGCGGQKKEEAGGSTAGEKPEPAGNPLLTEPHVCRGLNTCKQKGKSGDNACAGQSICATAKGHDCAQQNACKGQGGCGNLPGTNTCKETGGCKIPLMDDAWKRAREAFEKAMADAGKQVGPAPPKSENPADSPEKKTEPEKTPAEKQS